MHAYSIHRDPRNFSKPDTFWPERWLLAASPDSASAPEGFVHDAQAFIPFSHGPMNCVGRALGLAELRAVLCALVRRFDFRLVGLGSRAGADGACAGDRLLRAYEADVKDFFVTERPAVRVVLEPRRKNAEGST